MTQNDINILISSIGRRVHLQACIKNAMSETGTAGKVITTDASWSAPGLKFSDKGFVVPKSLESYYIDRLLDIIKAEKIGFLIPSGDIDLTVLSQAFETLTAQGVTLLMPSPEMVCKCADKAKTWKIFNGLGLAAPRIFPDADAVSSSDFPVVVKSRGCKVATTKGFTKIATIDDLAYSLGHVTDPIVQEFVEGHEFTVDTLTDLNGKVISVVPRRRVSLREYVSDKGETVRDSSIVEEVLLILDKLKPKGFCNLQCIKQDGVNYWIEVNPRISGGIPLFLASCPKLPFLLLEILEGNAVHSIIGEYEVGCFMAKYDEVLIFDKDNQSIPIHQFEHHNWNMQ